MLRVIAGELAGRRLVTPSGTAARPTMDRVREAVFNIIVARVPEAQVLDLYSGTGAMAIEALSRGARAAYCVEPDRRIRRVLLENLRMTGLSSRAHVTATTAENFLAPVTGSSQPERANPPLFDLIFCDPPWAQGLSRLVAEHLWRKCTESGLVIVEHDALAPPSAPTGMEAVDHRRYGRTGVVFYRVRSGWRNEGAAR